MPRWLNIMLQCVGIAGSGFAAFGGFIPPAIAPKVVMGITAAQAAVGVIAHSYNPDGTSATTAYRPQ